MILDAQPCDGRAVGSGKYRLAALSE